MKRASAKSIAARRRRKPQSQKRKATRTEELLARVQELEDTLEAIRSGQVDALVITGKYGDQVFSLEGVDQPYRVLIEEMNEGAATLQPDGSIIFHNRCFARMLQAAPEQLVSTRFHQLLAPGQETALVRLLKLAHETDAKGEFTLLTKKGQLLPVELSLSPIAFNQQITIALVITDLTERKAAEAALQQANARLATQLAELEAFSYSVSHDLRAPLRAMQAYADILIEKELPKLSPDNRIYLERIGKAAARLDRLTREVLIYSRISREEISLQPLDLERLIGDIVEQYPDLQIACGHIKIKQPLLPVIGQESLMTQAMSNLLTNACKFVAPGTTPNIRIFTQPVTKPASDGARSAGKSRWVKIFVEDNGVGIAPEHHERIFRMFDRVHPEKIYPGTGIGLAIVKKAVERMGGTVDFESTLGKGSRFWIELRRAD